jgi:cytidine deaminase
MDIHELITQARQAQNHAVSPYSNFQVGAALQDADGNIHLGCNIENSSYGLSMCAERVALFKAISDGCRDFQAIAIVGPGTLPCPPCGACRQVMWDLAGDIQVIIVSGSDYEETKLSNLLPNAFGSNFLNPK